MPEFDVTFSFEKTFRVEAHNKDKAQEEGVDKLSYFLSDCQADLDQLMTIEIHHIEG
jgi:hypothetical protein